MANGSNLEETDYSKYEILKWEVIPIREIIEAVQTEAEELKTLRLSPGTRWEVTSGIKPIDLYVYLKARFGEPNGIMMLTKDHEDSDNMIHWHYSLRAESGRIDFLCWTFRLEIWHTLDVVAIDANELLSEIKRDFGRMAQSMKSIRQGLEKWKMFLNPYFRLKTMVESQLQELEDLELETISEPQQPRTPQEADTFNEAFTEAERKYTRAAQLCLNVRMLAPVWAESFINLLLFILVRSDVRKDNRLYSSFVRQNIDVRIRGLHLHCVGFASHIPYDEWDICKEFHTMINGRNDMLHGNVDPELTTFHELYFENKTPLFIEYKDFAFFSYKASFLNATPEQALKDYQIVQDLTAHILLCLSEQLREDVFTLLFARHLGWDEGRQRVGILFPDHMSDAVFSYTTSN
ncbi:MAG: hypothetical protein WBA43_20565 [Elainellaceae cyanobacterium]